MTDVEIRMRCFELVMQKNSPFDPAARQLAKDMAEFIISGEEKKPVSESVSGFDGVTYYDPARGQFVKS